MFGFNVWVVQWLLLTTEYLPLKIWPGVYKTCIYTHDGGTKRTGIIISELNMTLQIIALCLEHER